MHAGMDAAAWGTAIVTVVGVVAGLVAIPPNHVGRKTTLRLGAVGIAVALVLFAWPVLWPPSTDDRTTPPADSVPSGGPGVSLDPGSSPAPDPSRGTSTDDDGSTGGTGISGGRTPDGRDSDRSGGSASGTGSSDDGGSSAGPAGGASGGTAGGPSGGSSDGGLAVQADPQVVALGRAFTISGTGFEPNNSVSFRFATEQQISWPISGFAVVDGTGHFTARSSADLQVCDLQGGVLVYYGDSADLVRDEYGRLAQPVASTRLAVTCS
jgi:hypothetical protein